MATDAKTTARIAALKAEIAELMAKQESAVAMRSASEKQARECGKLIAAKKDELIALSTS